MNNFKNFNIYLFYYRQKHQRFRTFLPAKFSFSDSSSKDALTGAAHCTKVEDRVGLHGRTGAESILQGIPDRQKRSLGTRLGLSGAVHPSTPSPSVPYLIILLVHCRSNAGHSNNNSAYHK